MLEIEKTNTEKMLREFWLTHSLFSEHPELLKDDAVGRMYESLMAVRDVDGLKDWLRVKEVTDTRTNEPVRYEDVLGRIYRLAIHAEQAELQWAADGMARLADNGFHDTLGKDIPVLERQRKELLGDKDDAIVLFRQGNGSFAYGEDADRLFELMGWQTSEAQAGKKMVSWMAVSDEGLQALSEAGHPFHNPQANVSVIRVEDVSKEAVDNEMLSLAQQSIDAIRLANKHQEAIVSPGVFPVMLYHEGICDVESAVFLQLQEKNASLVMSNGRTEWLVKDGAWNTSGDGREYLLAAGERLHEVHNEALMQIGNYDSTRMQRQMLTDDILDEYAQLKKGHNGEPLIVKQDGFGEVYGDDAVTMASKYHLKLWDREVGNGQVVPMLMLTDNQMDMVLSVADDVQVAESRIKEQREQLALKPSLLNEGLQETLHFNESGIKKTRNGDFMVWGRLNGVELPDKAISPEMGIRYSRLSGGAEKEAVLRTALQQSYGAELSQLEIRSQSAGVRR